MSFNRRDILGLAAGAAAFGFARPAAAASLDAMIGQMLMMGTLGSTADGEWPRRLAEQIAQGQIGGVVLLGHNFKSRDGVRAMTRGFRKAAGGTPVFIALDQEGGKVQRLGAKLGYDKIPAARTIGAGSPEAALEVYGRMAKLVREAGFNMNLGPCVDLGLNAANPVVGVTERTYARDPEKVVAFGEAFVAAHRKHRVFTVLKHFPGHGSSSGDSHDGFVDISKSWQPEEIEPYKLMIASGHADAIMPGHLLHKAMASDGDPVSISAAAIGKTLRKSLGYKGLVISDDLQMGAVRKNYTLDSALKRAINAGVDMVMVTNSSTPDKDLPGKLIARVRAMVEAGEVSEARIKSAYARIMRAKAKV
jgi:beta-N-acetylhexosaminidase